MNKEKQIEEMAKQIYGNFGVSMSTARNIAGYLTNKKGYRKASEVAREIFDDVESLINLVCLMTGLNIRAFGKYAELKKKYTEDGK